MDYTAFVIGSTESDVSMNERELLQRIVKGEDLHTEFKSTLPQADELAASLVAFANTDGGQLLLGVANNGDLVGVPQPDRVLQLVDQVAYQNIQPPLTIVQETVLTTSGPVVVVNVPRGDQRPYGTNKGVYFIRTSSGRRRASQQELLRLFQASESLYYDEVLIRRASLADIDGVVFERYVDAAYPLKPPEFPEGQEVLLRKLNLVRETDGALRPTVACLLHFGREPQRFFPEAYVMAARIPGGDPAVAPSDVKRIEGRLTDILEDTSRFLRIHLPVRHRIEGFGSEAYPDLPEVALRETIINALSHRDYTVAGPVRVLIYDDRVEVRTPGGLPNTVTVDAIRLAGAHVPRNPTIYNIFSRLGLVTGIGSGIYRTIQEVRKAVGREPGLFVQGKEFVVSLPRRAQI